MDLGAFRAEEQVIWMNSVVNVLLSEQLITEKQRKNPKEKKKY